MGVAWRTVSAIVERIANEAQRQTAAKRFEDTLGAPQAPREPHRPTGQALAALKTASGKVARAHELKKALRGIFATRRTVEDVDELLTRFCSRSSRSRLPTFIRLAKTIRKHRDGIFAAVRLGVTNARN